MEDQSGELVRRTAHEFVRDTLRRRILSGALSPGTRLVQADLASQLKVSTTPVRESMRDLAAEGLIRLDVHRGAIVHELDIDEVREIYEIRRLLEPYALKRALDNFSDEDLEQAESLQRQMESESDPGSWADLNRRFHAGLIEPANLPRLSGILKSLRDLSAMYVGLSLRLRGAPPLSANHDHRELLDACAAKDKARAAAVLDRHLVATVEALERSSDQLTAPTSSQTIAG